MKLKTGPYTVAADATLTNPRRSELQALVNFYVIYHHGNLEVIDWPEGVSTRAKAERLRRAIDAVQTDYVAVMIHDSQVYLTRPYRERQS